MLNVTQQKFNWLVLIQKFKKNILSKETLIAVTTNIEGTEHLRQQRINSGSSLENPRVSSTDDVECFFSMIRDTIGQNCTTKELEY